MYFEAEFNGDDESLTQRDWDDAHLINAALDIHASEIALVMPLLRPRAVLANFMASPHRRRNTRRCRFACTRSHEAPRRQQPNISGEDHERRAITPASRTAGSLVRWWTLSPLQRPVSAPRRIACLTAAAVAVTTAGTAITRSHHERSATRVTALADELLGEHRRQGKSVRQVDEKRQNAPVNGAVIRRK